MLRVLLLRIRRIRCVLEIYEYYEYHEYDEYDEYYEYYEYYEHFENFEYYEYYEYDTINISFECWVLCLGERGVLVRMETVGRDGVPARVVTGAAWHLVVGAARGRWQEEIHSTGWSDKQTLTT